MNRRVHNFEYDSNAAFKAANNMIQMQLSTGADHQADMPVTTGRIQCAIRQNQNLKT
jgi:hypothetical protein